MQGEGEANEGRDRGAGFAPPDGTRAGFVAILGRPNAGKSTLMNALVGQTLSIVSPKAQTTWVPVRGILTTDRAQMVFVDTPGLLSDPADRLHRALLEAVARGVQEADVLLLLLDPTRAADEAARELVAAAVARAPSHVPRVVAVSKVDAASEEAVEREERWAREALGTEALRLSAPRGEGVPALLAALERSLPAGPFLYPEEEVATAPVRFFVAELVRETIFESFREEIPWSVLPRVEEYREAGSGGEGGRRTYIQVHLHVERASQKGILVGEGGATIRELGTRAREKIEAFLGEPVYLELWVKVLPRWRKKKGELRRMGLPVPEEG